MTLNSDFQKLYVDGLITLFELDARALGAGILRFHGHISYEDWELIYSYIGSDGMLGDEAQLIGEVFESGENKVWMRNIIWQGETFEPMALEVSGLEMRSDGKIALSLQPIGQDLANSLNDKILAKLKDANGVLPVSDKSDPQVISDLFGVSKGNFKKAIGALYKQGQIVIHADRIELS